MEWNVDYVPIVTSVTVIDNTCSEMPGGVKAG